MKKIGFGKKSVYVISENEMTELKSQIDSIIKSTNEICEMQMNYILSLKEGEILNTRACCGGKQLNNISKCIWFIKSVLSEKES